MGNKKELKFLILTVLFICACVAVYGRDTSEPHREKPPLREVFRHIEGYTLQRHLELIDEHEKMLKLDDYHFADYTDPSGLVNLYIGYYYSPSKAYAAHSPTICYPSQGWTVDTSPIKDTLNVGSRNINYQEITTSYDEQKELVLYWYQARLRTSTQVYRNKIDMGYNQLAYNDHHHGFIRVAVPFADTGYEATKKTAVAFINALYPQLEAYVTSPWPQKPAQKMHNTQQ